jgi:beta-lactamase class A
MPKVRISKQGLLIRCLVVASALLLLGNAAWFARYQSTRRHSVARASVAFPLLSRRVFMDQPNDAIINFVPLRKHLQEKFDALSAQKSFYFEYLPSGTSIRIGADNELVAASLIKVPLAMNLYKAAELGKIDLNKEVVITTGELDDAYGDLWQKGAGTLISLREAAKLALTGSDNTAAHVMFDHARGTLASDQESLNQLDIDQNMQSGQAVIDAKSYSSVLKSLYLSSYLQPKDSQELLGYLSRSTATNRLVHDLPKGLTVAHKIGVYNAQWAESDCGIVYVPKRPYVICVMAGLPEDQADPFIASISKQVYDFVSQQ